MNGKIQLSLRNDRFGVKKLDNFPNILEEYVDYTPHTLQQPKKKINM